MSPVGERMTIDERVVGELFRDLEPRLGFFAFLLDQFFVYSLSNIFIWFLFLLLSYQADRRSV